jgi:hypothetical protein
MIPKIIHYCWFGSEEMPPYLQRCMDTWIKNMPAYSLRQWNRENFDCDAIPFVKEAFEEKKWAFVADYIRLHALYYEGGIYLDTDVCVFKPFDEWLHHGFFSGIEYHPDIFERMKLTPEFKPKNAKDLIGGLGIMGAMMGAERHHPFVKDCLETYQNLHFKKPDGSVTMEDLVIGGIISKKAERYGFVYQDAKQLLENDMLILPSHVLAGDPISFDDRSYAIHLGNGSWMEKSRFQRMVYYFRNHHPRVYAFLKFLKNHRNISWHRINKIYK